MSEDSGNPMDVDRRTDESMDDSEIWKPTEIDKPGLCQSLKLVDNLSPGKISRLKYTNSGNAILALASNGIHLLWQWVDENGTPWGGMATTSVPPELWRPPNSKLVINDISGINPVQAVPCFAMAKGAAFVMSTSGRLIYLFQMLTSKVHYVFHPQPPATFLAFLPQDQGIFAIGYENSVIIIYDNRQRKVVSTLRGHSKRITGLAFSEMLNVMVSSGADARLCVWDMNGWGMKKSNSSFTSANAISETKIEFHKDLIHLLVVNQSCIATFEASGLLFVGQWVPGENTAPITHATFSCDGELIYASFLDATLCIFDTANLTVQCRISPAAYLPANILAQANTQYPVPLVLAANPKVSDQFAVGLTDGGVHLLEPLESLGKWLVEGSKKRKRKEVSIGPSKLSWTTTVVPPPPPTTITTTLQPEEQVAFFQIYPSIVQNS